MTKLIWISNSFVVLQYNISLKIVVFLKRNNNKRMLYSCLGTYLETSRWYLVLFLHFRPFCLVKKELWRCNFSDIQAYGKIFITRMICVGWTSKERIFHREKFVFGKVRETLNVARQIDYIIRTRFRFIQSEKSFYQLTNHQLRCIVEDLIGATILIHIFFWFRVRIVRL